MKLTCILIILLMNYHRANIVNYRVEPLSELWYISSSPALIEVGSSAHLLGFTCEKIFFSHCCVVSQSFTSCECGDGIASPGTIFGSWRGPESDDAKS